MWTKEQQTALALIERTAEQFIGKQEFLDVLGSGKKLKIKFGVDVTAPTIHLGHAVNLWMMRALQDLGHKVIFLVGDFTTRIGDPTGRDKKRPLINDEDIAKHTEAFIQQAKMVLRFDNPDLLEVRRNSEWLTNLSTKDFLELLSMVTHSRLISRDMFQKRIAEQSEIHMHELVYPVLQGYDSVVLESDLTIIGTDQLFNEMLGRFYQEKMGQKSQVIITSVITPGMDGGAKQSKSLNNYIGLSHSPRDKFGLTMTVIDPLIEQYFLIYTGWADADIHALKPLITEHPVRAKQLLAHAIVERYHGKDIADSELAWWQKTFSNKATPSDMPTIAVNQSSLSAIDLIKACLGKDASNTEIKTLFLQGAITVDDVKISEPSHNLVLKDGSIIKIGKRRWFKIQMKA